VPASRRPRVNFVRFVYDGDSSEPSLPLPPGGVPAGSAQIEHLSQRYFQSQGLVSDPTAFDGRSDYGPFIENEVAAGGLFVPPTNGACDDIFNLSNTSLNQMSDAAAHAGWTLARSQSPITQELTATATRAKKAKRGKRGKVWKYQGPFRVR
jgi:hypothetical protein